MKNTQIKKIKISEKTKNKIFKALTDTGFIDPLRAYQSSAGHTIPVTVNLRAVFSDPAALKTISKQFRSVIEKKHIQYVAGYEISGIPLAVGISCDSGILSFSLRKVKHDHGMLSAIAGFIPKKDSRIAVVDDGLASGKSMKKSVNNLKGEGFKNIKEYLYLLVTDVAYSKKNITWLKENNIKLYYLIGYSEYINWAVKNKYLSPIAGWAAIDGMSDQESWEKDNTKWNKYRKAIKDGDVWVKSLRR